MIGTQYLGNIVGPPRWAAEPLSREHLLPVPAKLDKAAFSDAAGISVVVGAAGAAANATTVPVDAIVLPFTAAQSFITIGNVVIPSGTNLYFSGTKKFARLTADVKLGDTAITVEALPTALVDNDTARYSRFGTLYVPSGIVVGRTYAERNAGTPFGVGVASDDELFISAFEIRNALVDDDIVLVKHNVTIKENYLPDYTTLTAAAASVITLTLAAGTDGGTFRVRRTDTNAETADLAWNITAANLQTALRTLTGDTGLTVGLAGEVYTLTFTTTFVPPPLTIVNDSTTDGGVWEGGVVVGTTTGGAGSVLGRIRQLYRCIVGVD